MPTMPDEVRSVVARARRIVAERKIGAEKLTVMAALADAVEVAYAAGRADERARVVADLRAYGLMSAADRIERGEHLDD